MRSCAFFFFFHRGVSRGFGFCSGRKGSNFSTNNQAKYRANRGPVKVRRNTDKTGSRGWSFQSKDFIRVTRRSKISRDHARLRDDLVCTSFQSNGALSSGPCSMLSPAPMSSVSRQYNTGLIQGWNRATERETAACP